MFYYICIYLLKGSVKKCQAFTQVTRAGIYNNNNNNNNNKKSHLREQALLRQ